MGDDIPVDVTESPDVVLEVAPIQRVDACVPAIPDRDYVIIALGQVEHVYSAKPICIDLADALEI